jgi:hypothetical protein
MQHSPHGKRGKGKTYVQFLLKKLVQIATKNQSQSRQTIQAESAQCYCDGDRDQDKF